MDNKRKHIVWVLANNSSAPYFNKFAENMANNNSIIVSFICLFPSTPNMIKDVSKYGHACYWIPFDSGERKISYLRVIYLLYKLFKKIKPNLVHGHLFDDSFTAILAARLASVKFRVCTKADVGFHFLYHKHLLFFDKLINLNSTHLVAISGYAKKYLIEYENVNPQKITLIHHGIDCEIFQKDYKKEALLLKEKFGLVNKKIVGTIGRIVDLKGHLYTIEAAEILCKENSNLVFVFIGKGNDQLQKEYIEILKNKNLEDKVLFLGVFDYNIIPIWFSVFDIYLHTSLVESFGFVVAEAMISKVPLITTASGCATDVIVHKENGYIINTKNSQDITDGINYLLKNDNTSIIENALKTANEKFSEKAMYNNHINFYKKIFEKS